MTLRATALFLALAAAGQEPGPTARFSSTTNLVIVNVFVRDGSGAPIEGLNQEDFSVLEDGKPQKLSVFEFQRLEPDESPAPAGPAARKTPPETPRKPAITPSAPGEVRYKDRRLLALLFDFSSMPPADQIRAQQAGLKFLRQHMTPSDLVSILTFANDLKVVQDFTNDRDLLERIISGFRSGEASELAEEAETGDTESGADTGAAFVADETEFNIFNTDRKLSALESAAKMLSSLPEKKALVYFSSGVGKTGMENQSQLLATVNAAVRSNVSFYPVDARGLVAAPPGGEAAQAAPRGTGIFSGQAQRQQRERFNDQQETLYTLAADTGGKALLDTNDLSEGIVQAQQDMRSYYILGYYSTNPQRDGRFRRIQVRIAGQAKAKLDYRSGYFAPKEFRDFSSSDKERQLEEALLLEDPVTDLPLALEIDYFRASRRRYFVPVSVKISGSEIELERKGANEVTEFDFIGQVRDPNGKLVASVRDEIDVKVRGANREHRSFQYETGFTVPPGQYTLKFLTRENQTGRMGTFEAPFTVPDLEAEQNSLRMSSVVWSNQREPLSAAVGAAEKRKKLIAEHPLVTDGQKLIPNVTRVFRTGQSLYVYFEVYDAGSDVTAAVSFYRGNVKKFESEPVRADRISRPSVFAFQMQIPLKELPPGRYTCQINVVDQGARKFAFRRSPLVLLPENGRTTASVREVQAKATQEQ